MTRNFIFVFILLATLTIINAIPLHKRATSFGPCPNVQDTFTVTMSPDPLISPHLTTITIAGEETSGRIINPLASLVITIGDVVPVQPPSVSPVCNSTDCPGSKVAQTVTFLLNATLPPSYQIVLSVGNINTSSPQMEFINDEILACALATVP
ncbi:hypothetical protein F8M41_013466 [Gigaspora margarita]|uniref:Phosphatidylglycerol/phosphatidylinositol transfer protein n=1 Tax=Gigaspora margarita TaxID=4874 RepID=A0A8H4EPA5_GIGMA|nr:hypothetical protein F8M41_013466 [Gigaspora margarita]